MNIEVLKTRDTPLLSRKRVSLMVEYEGKTPSRLKLKHAISKEIKADANLVIVKHIYVRFGQTRAKVIVNVYADEAKMKILEGKGLLAKHVDKEKPKEEKAEAPAAEAPAAKAPAAEEAAPEEKKEE